MNRSNQLADQIEIMQAELLRKLPDNDGFCKCEMPEGIYPNHFGIVENVGTHIPPSIRLVCLDCGGNGGDDEDNKVPEKFNYLTRPPTPVIIEAVERSIRKLVNESGISKITITQCDILEMPLAVSFEYWNQVSR